MPLYSYADELLEDEIYDREEYLQSVPDTELTDGEIIGGVMGSERLWELIKNVISIQLSGIIGSLPGLVVILLFAVICNSFASDDKAAAALVINLIAYIYVFRFVLKVYELTADRIETLCGYSLTLSGVMISFLTFDPSLKGAAVVNSSSVMMYTFLTYVARNVMPSLCAIISVTAISSGSGKNLGSFSGMITGLYFSVLGVSLSIMSLIVSFQYKAAIVTDSVIRRGVKLASAYTIPVVGGALSESLDNISRALNAVRSSFGFGASLVVILTVLPVIVNIIVYKVVLSLLAVFSEMSGSSGIHALVKGMDTFMNVLLITCTLASLAFLYSLLVFCGNGG